MSEMNRMKMRNFIRFCENNCGVRMQEIFLRRISQKGAEEWEEKLLEMSNTVYDLGRLLKALYAMEEE